MDSPQFLCKVVIIGDSGVGKTSILNKRIYDKFTFQTQTTIQAQQTTLKLKPNNQEVLLKIWDTAGQEKFRTITIQFYRETKGAFLIFDMTQRPSFENIKFWSKQLRNHGGDDIVKIILGNKCDLEDKLEVTEQEMKELALSLNAHSMIVSAYSGKNIQEAFDLMGLELVNRFGKIVIPQGTQLTQNTQSVLENQQKGGCC